MTWEPNLDNVPQPLPTQNLLRKAVWKLYQKRMIMNPREVLKDKHGIYGFRYGHFIVVAKKEPYGNCISIHRSAILKAMDNDIQIMLWLDTAKKFYLINPYKVLENGEINYKGSSPMLNFKISLCKALDLKGR